MGLSRNRIAVLIVVVLVISAGLTVLVTINSGTKRPEPVSGRTAKVWLNVNTDQSTAAGPGDAWGEFETFHGAKMGTLNYFGNVTLTQSPNTEAVVLDGYVWVMSRGTTANANVLRYTPGIGGTSWNMSFEAYAPNGGTYIGDDPSAPQRFALNACVVNGQGVPVATVELSYGTVDNTYIRIGDGQGVWSVISESIQAAETQKTSEYGFAPDRYIISFQHIDGQDCVVSVTSTASGLVGSATVPIPSAWGSPYQLVVNVDTLVQFYPNGVAKCGSWAIDNLGCRGGSAPYPIIGPLYEYAAENGTRAGDGQGRYGTPLTGASVTISGVEASYNGTTQLYEADLPMSADWNKRYDYVVKVNGILYKDRMALTMVSSPEHAFLPLWWNGWDWVSVFGQDDVNNPQDILRTYSGYDHPLTAYVISPTGNANDILATQSELGIHNPHGSSNYNNANAVFWNEAMSEAINGQSTMDAYPFASRWDNPASGGQGRTFISMANPGNLASYEKMYALYESGVRIDGRSSERSWGTAGNFSEIGSWYTQNYGHTDLNAAWYPYSNIDMMDACRQLSWDFVQGWNSTFGRIDYVASHNGVLRAYGHDNHGSPIIMIPDLMHWIDNAKTNYSLENWKATDGEVASYVHGRWSTDVSFSDRSTADAWVFDVSRKDPQAAGYWRVPVTVGVDLDGRAIKDIVVKEGGRTYRMSDGSLQDLDGKRIMDLGYDVRDGKLYVSRFWNSNATLTVIFEAGPSTVTDMIQPFTPMMREP